MTRLPAPPLTDTETATAARFEEGEPAPESYACTCGHDGQRVESILRPFEDLFAGGPDTSCRTMWRKEPGWSLPGRTARLIECVEVPLDDLRAAFDEARRDGQR